MENLFLRGNFLPTQNAYIAQNEPLIFHCHHYNTFLQATIEDSSSYLDVYPILIDSAHDIIFQHFSEHFKIHQITDVSHRKKAVEDFFRFCGYGKIDLSNLTENGGEIEASTEHYSTGWLSKFGKRYSVEKPVSFFASGFLAGATEAIFDINGGNLEAIQTKCITKGANNPAFDIKRRKKPIQLHSSPQMGNFQTYSPINPNENINYVGIRDALTSMAIEGSEKNGLIDAFGVLLTRMYANYYCLISYRFLKELEKKMGKEGNKLATDLLTEAGHVCAFNTFGGVMESAEWAGLIKPMIKTREDWVHGIVAVVNAFGWGFWEIIELVPDKRLVIKITSGYEANSFTKIYPQKSAYPISFLARGGTAGIMNLIYNGDITQQPTLDDNFYKKICLDKNLFVSTQIKCRAMGDDYDLFEVIKNN